MENLNWLIKNSQKDIPRPKVVFCARGNYGGYYLHPFENEVMPGEGRYYDGEKGLIIIFENNKQTDGEIASTLAHEFRHHLQWLNNIKQKVYYDWPLENNGKSHKQNILDYFLKNPIEMDALLFENRMAPSDYSLEWEDWVRQKISKGMR